MKDQHISQNDLVALADGELSSGPAARCREHLEACWTCRTRMKELEDTIAAFVHAHQESSSSLGNESAARSARAIFRARMAQAAMEPPPGYRERFADFLLAGDRLAWVGGTMAAVAGLLFVVGVFQVSHQQYRLIPDPQITPGLTRSVSETEICIGGPSRHRVIPVKVGRQVFDRYGIDRPKPRDYELDYLIAPELGGADDPRNYWPQPINSSKWNAHVKDALEDRLHTLVCENKLDLATAQRDISADWIAAYKKYFATDEPIASHVAFTKDMPWEP